MQVGDPTYLCYPGYPVVLFEIFSGLIVLAALPLSQRPYWLQHVIELVLLSLVSLLALWSCVCLAPVSARGVRLSFRGGSGGPSLDRFSGSGNRFRFRSLTCGKLT